MERAPSPTASTAPQTSRTPSSPSSGLPAPLTTTPAPPRIHHRRRKPPVSIPTLHLIETSATTPSRPSSPTRPVHAHAAAVSGTFLSLASTFVVVGQPKVITALPSDPAVARLPKHLALVAARALQPNLQVLTHKLPHPFFPPSQHRPGISRRLGGGPDAGEVQRAAPRSTSPNEESASMAATAGSSAGQEG
jgi:hypothetical protein